MDTLQKLALPEGSDSEMSVCYHLPPPASPGRRLGPSWQNDPTACLRNVTGPDALITDPSVGLLCAGVRDIRVEAGPAQ
jgi:hypothetical protein